MKFCGECAAPLAAACPRCGFENPPGHKFCGQCAAPLSTSTLDVNVKDARTSTGRLPAVRVAPEAAEVLSGERKTVTALFADIKGSMELMEDLDPEEARAIVDPALKLMIDAVHRYDGYIVQSTGDGIFALFGAPVAHEDHPQRALYAALRMQEEYAALRRAAARAGKAPICRSGSASTPARSWSARFRPTTAHAEYTPIGHSTSLAARLQTLANPGVVVIGESMRRLAEGYFQLEAAGTGAESKASTSR